MDVYKAGHQSVSVYPSNSRLVGWILTGKAMGFWGLLSVILLVQDAAGEVNRNLLIKRA